MIMQNVEHQLKTIKESTEVQKKIFQVEMKELQKQLHKMEIKWLKLEKKLSLFKAKKEKLGKQLGKDTLQITKNQSLLIENEKSRENLMKFREKQSARPRSKKDKKV